MKTTLTEIVAQAIATLFPDVSGVEVLVAQPKESGHGDYMTAVALSLAKKVGQSPMVVAEQLVQQLVAVGHPMIAGVTVAAPGFINISLVPAFFTNTVQAILSEKEQWGASTQYAGKRILVEHSSPNLFKAFHVGHVMNNAIGESLVRLARFSGATVTSMSYPSDVSLGIGKAIWMLLQDGGFEKLSQYTEGTVEEIEYLGSCYVRGTAAYTEQPEIQEQVRAIAINLFNKTESSEYTLYLETKKRNMAYFEAMVQLLGSQFDAFIFESESGVVGKKIVQEHTGGDHEVFSASDNAVVYKGEQDGLHTRVFINHEGNPTYEAKDIGLLSLKFDRYNPDLSLFVTDHEQQEYFKVVLAAAARINPAWKEKSFHRVHGRMAFAGKKMSSRLGGVPSAQALLDTVYDTIAEKAPALLAADMTESKQAIAIAALKFAILRVMAGKNMNFDPETSLSFEGDTGPYVQYSIVRALSVLRKGMEGGIVPSVAAPEDWQTTALEKTLIHFPEVVQDAIADWSPHHIVGYLLALTQSFNSWYGNTKIIDTDQPQVSAYKLALTEAFAQVATTGLTLLGIRVPDKM